MMSIGDLSRGLSLQLRQGAIKSDLSRLTEELTTGIKTDPAKDMKGDLAPLLQTQRELNLLQAFAVTNTQARLGADATQQVLGDIQALTERLGVDTLKADLSSANTARAAISSSAREVFSTVVSRLNSAQAGRSLFAGTATDRGALISADDIVADVKTALAGATTASDIEARLDDWFLAPGGAFETTAYTGAATDAAPHRLSDGESVSLAIRADDAVFRGLMKNTLMAQLATDADLGLSASVQTALLRNAGNALIDAQTGLTDMRASVGAVQERIAMAEDRNSQLQADLRLSRNALMAADPYETATRLEQVQSQLEALYTVTARNSRLSLVDYLR